MTPRAISEAAGTLALVLLVLWGLHAMQGRAEARGQAQVWQERAEALRAAQDSIDDAAERVVEAATREREQAEARADSLARIRPEMVTRVVERIVRLTPASDSASVRVVVQAAVDTLEAAHAEEVRALRSALATADTIIRAQAAQIAVRDERIMALEAEAAAWQRAAAGGWWDSGLGRAAVAALGGAVGWAAHDILNILNRE